MHAGKASVRKQEDALKYNQKKKKKQTRDQRQII